MLISFIIQRLSSVYLLKKKKQQQQQLAKKIDKTLEEK